MQLDGSRIKILEILRKTIALKPKCVLKVTICALISTLTFNLIYWINKFTKYYFLSF